MNAPVLPRSNNGFTLLEVLIATTLLGIMMLLLTGSLRIGAESWDAGEKRIVRASRMFIVQNFLRSHIGSLLPVSETTKTEQIKLAFRGARDSLEYVAALPEQVRIGGLFRFELYVSQKGDHKDLRLAIFPYVANPKNKNEIVDPIDDLALIEDIKEITLSYLPRMPPSFAMGGFQKAQEMQWVEEWQKDQLPALIRLDIEPEHEDPWPSLVIALKTLTVR